MPVLEIPEAPPPLPKPPPAPSPFATRPVVMKWVNAVRGGRFKKGGRGKYTASNDGYIDAVFAALDGFLKYADRLKLYDAARGHLWSASQKRTVLVFQDRVKQFVDHSKRERLSSAHVIDTARRLLSGLNTIRNQVPDFLRPRLDVGTDEEFAVPSSLDCAHSGKAKPESTTKRFPIVFGKRKCAGGGGGGGGGGASTSASTAAAAATSAAAPMATAATTAAAAATSAAAVDAVCKKKSKGTHGGCKKKSKSTHDGGKKKKKKKKKRKKKHQSSSSSSDSEVVEVQQVERLGARSCDFPAVPSLHGFLQFHTAKLFNANTTYDQGPDGSVAATDHPPTRGTFREVSAWQNVCATINDFEQRRRRGEFGVVPNFRMGPPRVVPVNKHFHIVNATAGVNVSPDPEHWRATLVRERDEAQCRAACAEEKLARLHAVLSAKPSADATVDLTTTACTAAFPPPPLSTAAAAAATATTTDTTAPAVSATRAPAVSATRAPAVSATRAPAVSATRAPAAAAAATATTTTTVVGSGAFQQLVDVAKAACHS